MNISLLGYGKTTRAIAEYLGGGLDFYDDRCTESWVDESGNRIHPSSQFDPQRSDLEILTPSIRPESPMLARARNPVSEYDFFLAPERIDALNDTELLQTLRKRPRPLNIWISGTNGKTTTTQMLTHLLAPRGALSGGNIGTPLAALDPSIPIWILETSSFTLHHTRFARPDLYLLLPVTPDHIDWHGSSRLYIRDKLSPIARMREGELALVPDAVDRDLPDSPAWVVSYPDAAFLEEFFDLDSSRLRYKAAFLLDALLALAVTRTLFDEAKYERLNRFDLDRHRQEEVVDVRGRLWVNDSKATNLDATLQALNAYAQRRIHLIAGGDAKGVDMTPLIRRLSTLDARLYAIGSNRAALAELARKHGIWVREFEKLPEALAEVDRHLHASEVALLSPAASSLDQFDSYAQRGDLFVSFVRSLSTP